MTKRSIRLGLVLACLWGCTSGEDTPAGTDSAACRGATNCTTVDSTTPTPDTTSTQTDTSKPTPDSSQTTDTTTTKSDTTQTAGTPVYVTVFSHNERTLTRYGRVRENKDDYVIFRNSLIRNAKLFQTYGVHYSWQSDYVFIEGIQNFEAQVLQDDPSSTNGKPILVYLKEDLGVSIEVHAHECVSAPNHGDCKDKPYNYADVAYQIKTIGGVEPNPVIGGSSALERQVADFANCLKAHSVDFTWCPEILTGYAGAQGGHKGTDDTNSGIWNPTEFSDSQFTVHNPNGKLHYVGSGYSLGLFGTSFGGGPNPIDYIKWLVNELATGKAPGGKIYTASFNFNEDMIVDNDYYDELEGFLKTLKPYVDSGQIVYVNFPEVVNIWKTTYSSEPNIFAYQPAP